MILPSCPGGEPSPTEQQPRNLLRVDNLNTDPAMIVLAQVKFNEFHTVPISSKTQEQECGPAVVLPPVALLRKNAQPQRNWKS